MMEEKFVKVPVFPLTKYMTTSERGQMPAPMKPVSFYFGQDYVQVDEVLDCERGVSRKVGGMGFRFVCSVSRFIDSRRISKQSVIWFDDFVQEWFVEVPESRVPVDWDTATQISNIDDSCS